MLTTIYSKKPFLWAAFFLKNTLKLLLCSYSIISNPFWPHGLQHAKLPRPSLLSWSLLKLMSFESMMPSNHLLLCRPLLLLPSILPSITAFSNETALTIWWPKYWSFSMSPSSEYTGLISFGIDWFDLLAIQGILSLFQHHSSKASIPQCSAFLIAPHFDEKRQWMLLEMFFYITFTDNISMRDHTQWILTLNKYS